MYFPFKLVRVHQWIRQSDETDNVRCIRLLGFGAEKRSFFKHVSNCYQSSKLRQILFVQLLNVKFNWNELQISRFCAKVQKFDILNSCLASWHTPLLHSRPVSIVFYFYHNYCSYRLSALDRPRLYELYNGPIAADSGSFYAQTKSRDLAHKFWSLENPRDDDHASEMVCFE